MAWQANKLDFAKKCRTIVNKDRISELPDLWVEDLLRNGTLVDAEYLVGNDMKRVPQTLVLHEGQIWLLRRQVGTSTDIYLEETF